MIVNGKRLLYKFSKCLKVILIIIIVVLFVELLRIFECLNSRSSSLVYAYDIVKSDSLIGMDYFECCDYIEKAKTTYGHFDFVDEYATYDDEYNDNLTCRKYHVGYALNNSGRNRSFFLKVYFYKDKVILAIVEEEKA